MPKSGKAAKARGNKNHGVAQTKQARTLDALMEFDKFNESILPQLRKAILENWSSERMRKHFAPYMQAMMIEKGFKGDFKAMKDVLDRHEGMAVQRVEQKTMFQKMERQELAALALQKLFDAKIIDTTGRVILEPELIDEDTE